MRFLAVRFLNGFVIPWPLLVLAALWTWAIWSCAEHWQGNPNYSYGWAVPLLCLGFGIRRFLMLRDAGDIETSNNFRVPGVLWFLAPAGLGAIVFFLEYARQQMWHPGIVIWTICGLTAASTIAILWVYGGRQLAWAEMFPVLFFLTAVPWPPRVEQPITGTLMRWVAVATTELLHWIGIEAQTSGAAIALRSGLVGITEACSGIRSLQAGIMFGLAMGEWFLLSTARRIILLVVAILLALITNLGRTLALTLQTEWHGPQSLDHAHDLIGNVTITTLIVAIWFVGKLLARPTQGPGFSLSIQQSWSKVRLLFRDLNAPATILFRVLALSIVAALLCARVLYARVEAQDQTQKSPFFIARIDNTLGNQARPIPSEIWKELRPASGEYIRHESAELPGGGADCFHFFWKPSAWNRFVLVHRPDICMPGVGWEMDGPVEPVNVVLDGHPVRCYLFRFRRGNANAVQLWGAWRNGEAVPLDYRPEQVLGAEVPPASMRLEGKRRSATEIVSCSVITTGTKPSAEIAMAVLPSVFNYKPQ